MVPKGEFITAANPNLTQFRVILIVGVLLAAFFLLLAYVIGSWIVAALAVICIGSLAWAWFNPRQIVREVHIYENGIERSMPGKLRDSRMFLPWSAVEEYRWEGDILRFKWAAGAFLLFRGNQPASSQRLNGVKPGLIYDFIPLPGHYGFPTEVHVPAVYGATIQSILTQAGQR